MKSNHTHSKGNADRTNSPAIVQHLLSLDDKSLLDTPDSDSCLPLQLLNAKAALIEETDETARENVINCVKFYLEGKPKLRSEFLVAIRSMPEWLGDVAVIHPTVQTMLNTKITSRYVKNVDSYFDLTFTMLILNSSFIFLSLLNQDSPP